MSTRKIEPFIRKYHITMAEFEPVRYRSFAEFKTAQGAWSSRYVDGSKKMRAAAVPVRADL